LAVVADLSESQDRQRDRDRDEASPHTDILVRRQAGVKESDANSTPPSSDHPFNVF
jgi:hypothetical protein